MKIATANLKHHPLNPRINIENLEELTDSIRKNGVLQNLTVIEDAEEQGTYYVIIGNRRLEAAIKAEVPEIECNVVDMPMEDVISAMMQENMMRENLKLYEEANGFQTMLDLGKTVEQISEMSGFSESTIRRRTKLAGLDKENLTKAVDRGATLFDLEEINKLESEEARNEVLKAAGTKNFKNRLEDAIQKDKTRKSQLAQLGVIQNFAEEVESIEWDGNKRVAIIGDRKPIVKCEKTYYSSVKPEEIEIPNDEKKRYYYINYGIEVYREITEEELKSPEQIRKEAITEASDTAAEEFKTLVLKTKNVVKDFIVNYKACKKALPQISKAMTEATVRFGSGYTNKEDKIRDVLELIGEAEVEEGKDIPFEREMRFNQALNQSPERIALITLYSMYGDVNYIFRNWKGDLQTFMIERRDNALADFFYQFLESIGYVMSEEEMQIVSGTHEIFKNHWYDEFRVTEEEKNK